MDKGRDGWRKEVNLASVCVTALMEREFQECWELWYN